VNPLAGILDTSVVIALDDHIDRDTLPVLQAITAITLGELSVGPLVTRTADEQARRQRRLQMIERRFADATLAYDAVAARVFGAVMAGALHRDRSSRARVADYQIAAIAIANGLALYTVNVDDFAAIDGLQLMPVGVPPG
jgi:tRNA(fMet)-specific endonuclease VapC